MSRAGHVWVLRVVRADMTSRDGFRWPTSGPVEAPDWSPTAECGRGLHGWMRGEGDGSTAPPYAWEPDARWLVVEVAKADVIDLGGKVKFPRGTVVMCGARLEATTAIAQAYPGAIVVGGTATAGDCGTATAGYGGTATAGYGGTATATAGDGGTATAGDRGTATAGDGGTATAGYGGTITIRRWDSTASRYRLVVGYIGEGGLLPEVAYRLDDAGAFTRADGGAQ